MLTDIYTKSTDSLGRRDQKMMEQKLARLQKPSEEIHRSLTKTEKQRYSWLVDKVPSNPAKPGVATGDAKVGKSSSTSKLQQGLGGHKGFTFGGQSKSLALGVASKGEPPKQLQIKPKLNAKANNNNKFPKQKSSQVLDSRYMIP